MIAEFASLGVGAALAALIFLMYRADKITTEKRIQFNADKNEERLTGLLKEENKTRRAHTKALKELTIVVKGMNGKK